MLHLLASLDRWFDLLLRALVMAASATITLSLTALVVCRYGFGVSLMGSHEASLFAAMWLYMCGAVLASRRSEHLVVDILASGLAGRMKQLHQLLISVLTVVISGLFILWVWQMFAWGIKRPQTIPVLDLPLWMAQAPIALAALTGLLYGLRDLIRAALPLLRPAQEA